jgi:hypothetical protein
MMWGFTPDPDRGCAPRTRARGSASGLRRVRAAPGPRVSMFLWSEHDEVLHHKRRYRRRPLKALIEAAGLRIDWLSYYNTLLFPPVAAVRVARKLVSKPPAAPTEASTEADGTTLPPAPVNALLKALFAVERHVIGRMHLPIGVSLIGVARKP